MIVSRGKASLSSDLSIDGDLDFLTTYQVKRLATPASGEALRKGNKDIGNAEIADTANIAATKILNVAMTRALLTTQGDLLIRGASVPQRLAKITTGHFLKATATGYEGAAIEFVYRGARVVDFQEFVAEGDWSDVEKVNDNLIVSSCGGQVNDYAIIYLQDIVRITQYRYHKYLDAGQGNDAEMTIQYRNPDTQAWVDWVIGVVIDKSADVWDSWDNSGGEVVCDAIKLIVTKEDTIATYCVITELEVKF